MYIHIPLYRYVRIALYMCIRNALYTCIRIALYMCIRIALYMCIRIALYMCIRIALYMCIRIALYMYICISLYTYNLKERLGINCAFKHAISSHNYTLLPFTFTNYNIHVHTAHFILDHTFYTNFANEFLLKFEILYTLTRCTFCSPSSSEYWVRHLWDRMGLIESDKFPVFFLFLYLFSATSEVQSLHLSS
jgi:hypothetical protein